MFGLRSLILLAVLLGDWLHKYKASNEALNKELTVETDQLVRNRHIKTPIASVYITVSLEKKKQQGIKSSYCLL